ncbi:MAG: 1-(5-phosphoribosyl)-5-[(5-phosphoribosylamino)methylideneamino]imidazole-4-carboxamide isomerase, partial [Gammaproteobacteria bacterium]|nr:1-(5-phosphoribosyl)-5-[(5-phosphoribosylamino)methylideneamino]imidazole-4-carboxamide isomerase [Gammaproteobacteria bacterium]
MIIYPAIDLIEGACVRLQQGDFQRQSDYAIGAVELAQSYADAGADWLHVVDLDAARGRTAQLALIAKLSRIEGLQVQSGGGVRSSRDIEQRLQAGIKRVIVGSVCVRQPHSFIDWLRDFGAEQLVAALDVRQQVRHGSVVWEPAVSGWKEDSAIDLFALLEQLVAGGLQHLLCTDIGRDGMLGGPNLELYAQIRQRYPGLQLQASGGVHALTDLSALQQLGVQGVIIGKALLEDRFTLPQSLAALT